MKRQGSGSFFGFFNRRVFPALFALLLALPISGQAKAEEDLDLLTAPLVVGFTPSEELKQLLIYELLNAKESVDIAMFNLSDPDLLNTLCWIASPDTRRKSQAVRVRLLVDEWGEDEPFSPETMQMLTRHGVQVHLHKSEGKSLLHMKTAVVDGKVVMTGAANWSRMAFWQNIEDVLIFRDERIGKVYLDRIDYLAGKIPLWEEERGQKSRRKKRIPRLEDPAKLFDRRWEKKAERSGQIRPFLLPPAESLSIHFTPDEPFVPRVVELVNETKRSISAAFYLFSHHHIQNPMKDRAHQLDIEILLDEMTFTLNPVFDLRCQQMHDAGIEIYRCKETREPDSMHLKAAVFDNRLVWRSSANWSINANSKNYEEYTIIKCPKAAQFYTEYINTLRNNICKKY